MNSILVDVFNKDNELEGTKSFYPVDNEKRINDWILQYRCAGDSIGIISYRGNDFQNQNYIYISLNPSVCHDSQVEFNKDNLIEVSMYYAVRHCISATWLNDRDQFLYPSGAYHSDIEFQNDCLVFTLFHSQNRITCKDGVNHWLPFSEKEVGSEDKFASDFMVKFIKQRATTTAGLQVENNSGELQYEPVGVQNFEPLQSNPIGFSTEAKALFTAGREFWRYYHDKRKNDVMAPADASLYDIREYFKGRNEKGRMNTKSDDLHFNELDHDLREMVKLLAIKIKPKIYEYGFLLE
ncbi:MAG: hypothetical protein LBO69_01270 [Ignavibacteria bacterium]|jgi:hypothetical protein|nr:hypothetical protein [Ignavibacteria bacterium]